MNRRNEGFTLIELLIVIAIFGIVLAGTSQMFVSMLTTHRQQSKIAETNIEGILGLELLRQDLGKAGFGLPWNGLVNYHEAALLNDAPNAPKGIVSINNFGAPDYLVIKAANVATDSACNKWAFLSTGPTVTKPTSWTTSTPASDNFADTDRVIVLTPGSPSSEDTARTLVTSASGAFFAQSGSISTLASTMTSTGVAYGIDSTYDLRRPFNRADYYVAQPTTGMPQRCAAGTGILYKAVLKQSDDSLGVGMPLLDCVADMQVIYRYDPNGSGTAPLSLTNDISTWSAKDIRDKVKEVRVYILAHEGQKDTNFNYPASPPTCLGCDVGGSLGTPSFNFSGITDWQNYRWKIFTLVVKLDNLSPFSL